MIHYVDNFLPQDQFDALKLRVEKRFIPTDKKKFEANSDEPVRITYHDETGNWREGCNLLGKECIPAVEKIIKEFEIIGVQELFNWSLWYQYIIDTMTIPPHQDQGLRYSSKEHSYTAVIYTSDWQPGYGGEFVVGEPIFPKATNGTVPRAIGIDPIQIIEPKPNRMLIWSREVWHAVNKVTVDDPTYMRNFMGTGWSSISDGTTYRNIL